MPKTSDGAQTGHQHIFSYRFDDSDRWFLAADLVFDYHSPRPLAMLSMRMQNTKTGFRLRSPPFNETLHAGPAGNQFHGVTKARNQPVKPLSSLLTAAAASRSEPLVEPLPEREACFVLPVAHACNLKYLTGRLYHMAG